MSAVYIESKLDNQKYCKSNGQFTRHLRQHNLTYQQYFEQYVTKLSPKCECGSPLSFYQKTETYANSCGHAKCVGKSVSTTKQNLPEEIKKQQSKNYSNAQHQKTKEQRQAEVDKKKETYIKNYGVNWASAIVQKEKSANTKLERYGNLKFNNSTQSALRNRNKSVDEKNKINERRRKTNLERHGVENCFLKLGVKEKAAKSNSIGRDYTLPSDKIIGVRGYEDLALDVLLQDYNENELAMHDSKTIYQLPIFTYTDHRRHILKYYPDIYIPSENRIIEVKSRWWWDGFGREKYKSRLLNNLKKRKAVLDKGYNYEVWLFEDKKNFKVLTNDADFQT